MTNAFSVPGEATNHITFLETNLAYETGIYSNAIKITFSSYMLNYWAEAEFKSEDYESAVKYFDLGFYLDNDYSLDYGYPADYHGLVDKPLYLTACLKANTTNNLDLDSFKNELEDMETKSIGHKEWCHLEEIHLRMVRPLLPLSFKNTVDEFIDRLQVDQTNTLIP